MLASVPLAAVAATVRPPLDGASVLVAYARALVQASPPPNVTFEYSVEQLGVRDMQQAHRVYRSAQAERDETLAIDGHPLKAPAVRIFSNRVNRYAIGRVAPAPAGYTFAFRGAVNEPQAYGYWFATQPRGAASYAVTDVEIDGRAFLPRRINFKIGGANARGSGALSYGRVDRYWVILEADVSAHLADGKLSREHIRWSNYQFPASLPDSTFSAPRPVPTPP